MKQFFIFLIAALSTGIASANFVGLESELVTESEHGTVYRVYATFDNPTDELVAIYALETAPIEVTCSTSFFQSTVGSALGSEINPMFFSFFPDLEFDSWFTIGSENSNGTSDIQQVGMDEYFASFETGNGFTIDSSLVEKADKNAIILHCLPAYRSKEITDEVIESKKSRIFEQAENRMHAQQALLSCLLC